MCVEVASRWEDSLWDGPQGPAGRVHASQALCCLACDSNSGCSLAGLGPGQWARLLPALHR